MKGKIRISKKSEYEDDNMIHGNDYAFFHRPLHLAVPPRWYQFLISSATRCVDIWDPYFNYNLDNNHDDCRVFRYLNNSVRFRYLVVEGDVQFEKDFQKWEPVIASNIPSSLKADMEISFSYISGGDELGKLWVFHDRFLIIDNERVFLIGGSLGYHLSSVASTGIYELKDSDDKALVKDMFETYWTFSKKQNHVKKIAL